VLKIAPAPARLLYFSNLNMSQVYSTAIQTQHDRRNAFVPSPRWLSESPARPVSVESSNNTPSSKSKLNPWKHLPHDQLRSPAPPPPENLYGANGAGAFNVDPGVPFLATAGSSDAGDSEKRSVMADSPRKRFVGGFVTGVKKAVRRSLRDNKRGARGEEAFQSGPSDVRDSGYGSSSIAATAVPIQMPQPVLRSDPTNPPQTHRVSQRPRRDTYIAPAPRRGVTRTRRYASGAIRRSPTGIMSPQSIMSPVSADPEYGSDYAMMNPPPPKTHVSIASYLTRLENLIDFVSNLPWVSKKRVTVDYYPEFSRRDDPDHLPQLQWLGHNFSQVNYQVSLNSTYMPSEYGSSAGSSSDSGLKRPSRIPSATLDLDAEFNATPSAVTLRPLTHTPRYDRSQVLSGPPGISSITPLQSMTTPFAGPPALPTNRDQTAYDSARGRRRSAPPTSSRGYGTPRSQRVKPVSLHTSNHPQDEWEEYPRYANGYVAPQYAENHYGSEYGHGIHSARPGAPPSVPGPPSTASTRRRQSYTTPITPRS